MEMKKTLLIGNFGSANIGDELILNFSLEKYKKENVIVMTNDSSFSQKFTEKNFETISFFPTGFRSFFCFLFENKGKKEILSLRNKLSKIVFSGGGLFAIKFRAVFLWFVVFQWVRFLFKDAKIIFEYQGVDARLGFLSRFLMKKVFLLADEISVRDENSGKALDLLGIENYEIIQDLVHLNLNKCEKLESQKKEKIVLLNALSVFSEQRLEKIYLKFADYRVIFVCFDPVDRTFFPSTFGDVVEPKTKTEVFDLFASAEFCIGERLHFLILANAFCGAQNTFLLKSSYSEKVDSFCNEFGIVVFP